MSRKIVRFGPIALTTNLTTNILNPPTVTGGVNAGSSPCYIELRKVTIVNKTSSDATFSLWIGATGANAAGTEFLGTARSVRANSAFSEPVMTRLDSTDFLVGGAGTGTALTIMLEGYMGVAG
ncbi:MAG: hypothetical protein RLZZ182_1521 [Pseudomonadota bacterium]|jgi:hypothetical protein